MVPWQCSCALLPVILGICLLVCTAQAQIPEWLQNMLDAINGRQKGSCPRPPIDIFQDNARRDAWEETLFRYSQSSAYKSEDVGKGYNVFSEKCCLGRVHPLIPNTQLRCCGNKTYDTSTHTCCSGVINTFQPGKTCCGTTTIDIQKEVCCDGCIIKYPNAKDKDIRQNTYCCGGKPYDKRTQICCVDGTYVIIERSFKNASCCGSVVIDLDKQVCCLNSLVGSSALVVKREGKISADSCCDNKAFDSRIEFCCDNRNVYNTSVTGCCEKTMYDLKTQTCCFSKVFNSKSDDLDCCGETLYNKKEKLCCFAKLYDNPTGRRKCCRGSYDSRSGIALTHDPTTELCCSIAQSKEKVVLKSQPEDTGCCGNRTYNTINQLCCDGKIVMQKRSKLDTTCCAGEPFNTFSEMCCKDGKTERKYDKVSTGFDQCCDKTPISSTTHTCCGSEHILDLNSNFSCCDNKLYDTSTHVCCEDPLTKTSSLVGGAFPNAECCGASQLFTTLADGGDKICCGSTLHLYSEIPSDAICCGDAVYSPKSQRCCTPGVVRSVKSEGTSECCYNFITDEPSVHARWRSTYQPQDYTDLLNESL